MHPYSYNRLRMDTRPQDTLDSENAEPAGGNPESSGAGSSPDLMQVMAMMEAMRGGKTGGSDAGPGPDLMKLLTMLQAMRSGASGGNGIQNILPMLSALGGKGLPPNMNSVLESVSGGSNGSNAMLSLLQGMMPPQTAQLFNMLSTLRSSPQ
ncbi:MAG: hypothetical protein ACOYU3_03445 [Bacillota bacterium]